MFNDDVDGYRSGNAVSSKRYVNIEDSDQVCNQRHGVERRTSYRNSSMDTSTFTVYPSTLSELAQNLVPMCRCVERTWNAVAERLKNVTTGVLELTLSDSDRKHIFDFKYAKTPEEVESFKAWIPTVPDPQGELKLRMLGWWDQKLMHRWLLPGLIQCLSKIPLEQWNTMEPTTNLGEAQHAWNNAQTGISMGIIESFKKAAEIEIRMATAISRNSQSEVSQRYASRTARQSRKADKVRTARAFDANVATLQQELSETKDELKAARSDAKSNSSGRVPKKHATVASTSKATAQAPSGFEPALRAVAAPPELLAPATPVTEANRGAQSNVEIPGARRTSTRKRVQPDSPEVAPVLSRKRRKKLVDPLAGWDMEDPDTGEQLTGHEWVRRYPEEFKQHYKRDHQRYLEFLAQSADS
ncbi:hypothetical protein DFH06DRAFT_1147371 [Mycena polygramma]|nr:hypothetical protein DFH06DRAFT_1147371 [Mycena polygramma]